MRISEWCEAAGMKPAALAEEMKERGCDISRQSLSTIMKEKKEPTISLAIAFHDISGGLITYAEMVPEDKPLSLPEKDEVEDLLAAL